MAKKLKYVFDIKKLRTGSDKELPQLQNFEYARIFENLFVELMSARYKEGVSGPNIKIMNRILKQLGEDSSGTISVESAELDLLKDLFLGSETIVHPKNVRIFCVYQEEIEKLVKGE